MAAPCVRYRPKPQPDAARNLTDQTRIRDILAVVAGWGLV